MDMETTITVRIHRHASDLAKRNVSGDEYNNQISYKEIQLNREQKWRTKAPLPATLLSSSTEGMSARSQHRIRQSTTGLDDAGMDLQSTQLNSFVNKETQYSTILPWIMKWQLSFSVALCVIVGVTIFTFLILLWLRKQMSREKDIEEGDRRGLVEEGVVISSEKPNKTTKGLIEPHWVHPSASVSVVELPVPIIKQCVLTTELPQTMSVATTPERKSLPTRMKAKGLLERRGSSASLTIELAPAPDSPPHLVTPTRECTAEEFLLGAGNPLSRIELRKSISDPSSLHKEFWEVPLNLPDKVDVCGSGVKNRYGSVLPNPTSRVILPGASDDPLSSYINANYIKGYNGEDARYIATQGPLPHTIGDFWKMVWSERVPVIVMMTRLREAAKPKCDPYFPLDLNARVQDGSFTVITNSIDMRDGYIVRDLELRHEGERRHVQHYWYDSWPDHAIPEAADALISLIAEVNNYPGPIVVHCSAGIGRTGCFIALAIGMTQLLKEENVDVLGILCQMRYDRGGMVQTAEQYEFIHRALCLFERTLDRKSSISN